jgi:hypothetical protein
LKETDGLVHVLYRSDVKLFDASGNRVKVYRSDVELFDSSGDRVKVVNSERGNEANSVVFEVKLREPDEDRAELISVKRDGAAWKLLPGNEIEQALGEWQKMIQDVQGYMRKFAEALAQEHKARQKSKSKRRARNR